MYSSGCAVFNEHHEIEDNFLHADSRRRRGNKDSHIPLSSPKLATVVDLTKVGALIRVGREDVDDIVLHHSARAQADVLARALLT